MEEKVLVTKAIGGDQAAFCELYDLYKDKLYRYAFYKLGNPEDAEDAVSDCVLSAWSGIGKLKSSEAFSSWIFRILSRCCIREIKLAILDRDSVEAAKAGYVDRTDSVGLSLELGEALDQLSSSEQDIVLLSTIGGFTSEEIAELTGMSAGGVRSKLSRSLAKMRSFLEA